MKPSAGLVKMSELPSGKLFIIGDIKKSNNFSEKAYAGRKKMIIDRSDQSILFLSSPRCSRKLIFASSFIDELNLNSIRISKQFRGVPV